jgi:hypothetical protein
MKLLVFKKEGENSLTGAILSLFNSKDYAHFVDGVHGGDDKYLRENFSGVEHRLVYVQLIDLIMFTTYDKVNNHPEWKKIATPDFVIYFDEGEVLEYSDWYFLKNYFRKLFDYGELPFVNRRGDYLLSTGFVPKQVSWADYDLYRWKRLELESGDGTVDECYDFKEYVNKERDVALFQVNKPYTDLPYTMVRTYRVLTR